LKNKYDFSIRKDTLKIILVCLLIGMAASAITFTMHYPYAYYPLGIILAWFLTQIMVFTSWIWFRLPNLQDSAFVIQNLWGRGGDQQFAEKVYVEALNISQYQLSCLLIGIALIMSISYAFKRGLKLEFSWPIKIVFVPLCFYAVWLLAPEGSLPYIYFDF
jgi:alginate O-acetyltransferase complex protein AlgI